MSAHGQSSHGFCRVWRLSDYRGKQCFVLKANPSAGEGEISVTHHKDASGYQFAMTWRGEAAIRLEVRGPNWDDSAARIWRSGPCNQRSSIDEELRFAQALTKRCKCSAIRVSSWRLCWRTPSMGLPMGKGPATRQRVTCLSISSSTCCVSISSNRSTQSSGRWSHFKATASP